MGAIEIAGTWRTTAPRQDVWDVVVDLRTWPQWWPAITDVEVVRGSAPTPDAARLTFDTPVRPLVVQLAVTERSAPDRLVVRAEDGPLSGGGAIELAEDDGGTATAFALDLRLRSLLFKPLERVLGQASRGPGRERLAQAGDDLARLAGGDPREHRI